MMEVALCAVLLLTCIQVAISSDPAPDLYKYGKLQAGRNGPYRYVTCDMNGMRTLFDDVPNGVWRLEPMHGETTARKCPPPTCEEFSPDGVTGFHEVMSVSRYEGDNTTVTCKGGYKGTPRESLRFTCKRKNKKKCKKTVGKSCIKFFWKPMTRNSARKKIQHITCQALGDYCPVPSADEKWVLHPDNENTYGNDVYEEKDMAQLTCKPGFGLNTSEPDSFYVSCKGGGKWDRPFPACIPERDLRCKLPRIPIPNMVPTNRRYLKVGESVRFECDANYYMNPYNTLGTWTCELKGWNQRLPTCKLIQCPQLGMIDEGNPMYHRSPSGHRRGVGSQVVVRCNEGYKLVGSPRRTCTNSGSWDGELQRCDSGESDCENPGTPISGTKRGNSYNIGDTVEFSCGIGTTLSGSETRTCLYSGRWTGNEVKCTGPNEFPTNAELKQRMGLLIGGLSRETSTSQQSEETVSHLVGKKIMLGRNNMEHESPNARTNMGTLLDAGGIDLYILLDVSGSIAVKEKEKSIELIKALVQKLGASGNDKMGGTRLGLVAYASDIWKQAAPSDFNSKQDVIDTLDRWKRDLPDSGGTAPDHAFKRVKVLMDTANSDGNGQTNVVIVFLSDGVRNEGPDPALELDKIRTTAGLNGQEVHVYCIGVGTPNMASLKRLASEGDEYMLMARNWSTHNVIMQLLSGNLTDVDFESGVAGNRPPPNDTQADLWAVKGQWRWMMGVYLNTYAGARAFTDRNNAFHCGASLLSDDTSFTGSRWALTAAHCIKGYEARHFQVKLGSLKSSKDEDDNPLIIKVDQIFKHKSFGLTTLLNDIALLKLEEVVPYSYDIRPVRLPRQGSTAEYAVHQHATVTGWGMWNKTMGKPVEFLKNLPTRIQPDQSCMDAMKAPVKEEFQKGKNFCAGNEKRFGQLMDACTMDSGGPLVVEGSKTVDGQEIKFWTQIGIVSSGDGCGNVGKPGVYTHVSSYIDWIQQTKNENNANS